MLAVLLPLVSYVFITLSFARLSTKQCSSAKWRDSILLGAVVWGCLLVTSTELLSLLHLLSFPWILAFWVLSTLIPAGVYIVLSRKIQRPLRIILPSLGKDEKAGLLLVVLIFGTLFVVAIGSPPNNCDSLIYHMSRIMHWVQHRAVVFHPTHCPLQLFMPPGSEMAMLHSYILGDSDIFCNLVQWWSMLGSLAAVSLIARELHLSRRYQILAAVIAATIPIGILQAASTQNDYVVGFWILCTAYFLMRSYNSWSLQTLLPAAASLGLALLTKATAYTYAFPMLLIAGFVFVRTNSWRHWKHVALAALVVLALNAGHYKRNTEMFGNPVGASRSSPHSFICGSFRPTAVLANTVRHSALHVISGSPMIDGVIERGVRFIHNVLHVDINSPAAIFDNCPYQTPRLTRHEDTAQNRGHFFLLCIAVVILATKWPSLSVPLRSYTGYIVLTFMAYAAIIKWDQFGARLHLAFFLLAAPLIGATCAVTGKRWFSHAVTLLLLSLAIPYLLANETRSLVGDRSIFSVARIDQYLTLEEKMPDSWRRAVEIAADNERGRIGLVLPDNFREYPLWALLSQYGNDDISVRILGVNNITASLYANPYFGDYQPEAIISFRKVLPPDLGLRSVNGSQFDRVWQDGQISVHIRQRL